MSDDEKIRRLQREINILRGKKEIRDIGLRKKRVLVSLKATKRKLKYGKALGIVKKVSKGADKAGKKLRKSLKKRGYEFGFKPPF